MYLWTFGPEDMKLNFACLPSDIRRSITLKGHYTKRRRRTTAPVKNCCLIKWITAPAPDL